MSQEKQSYHALTRAMLNSNSSTTQKWDVLCSYEINAVNAVFQKHVAEKPFTKEFKYTTKVPGTDIEYTMDYNINFGIPTVQFLDGQNGQCQILFPISKGSTVTTTIGGQTKSPVEMPEGYSLSMVVPLACTIGDAAISKPSNEVISFGGSTDKAKIAIHFNVNEAGTTVGYEPPLPVNDPNKANFEGLALAFQKTVSKVDYDIVHVDPTSGHDGDLKLTPKSFVFTTSGTKDNSVLNVWIQTNESGNDQGNPTPVFQPGGNEMLSLPAEYKAAVIFSNDLIIKKYLTPALAKAVPNYEITNKAPDGSDIKGIGALLKPDTYTKDYSYDNSYLPFYTDKFDCDRVVIDYSKNPFVLKLTDHNLSINWDWSQTVPYSSSSSNFGGHTATHGKMKFDGTCNKTSSPFAQLSDERFSIKADVSKAGFEFTSEYIKDAERWEGFVGVFGQDNAKLRSDIVNDLSGISLTIDLGGLNYFAEANVIFQDKAFKVAPQNTGSDGNPTGGVCVTGDLMIVGDIS